MENYLIIADDFTGANDSGVKLTKKGIPMRVTFQENNFSAYSHVLDTETRNVPANIAIDKIDKLTKNIPFNQYQFIIKKVDSTLRGNIAAEVKALDEIYQSDIILFMPALPDLNRTTRHDIHYLNHQPLTTTEMANDPVKPITTDCLTTLLEESFQKESIRHIDIEMIREKNLAFSNHKIFTVDSETNDDMQFVIKTLIEMDKKILWVGSAGLVDNLVALQNKKKPALGLIGSISEVTQSQIKFAEKNNIQLIKIPIHEVITKKNSDEYIIACQNLLMQQKDTLILSSAAYDLDELEKMNELCKLIGIDTQDMNSIVQSILGEITEKVLQNSHIAGIFITGGETAISFLDKLQITEVEIMHEVANGVPLMKVTKSNDPQLENLKIITKAGAFGEENAIYHALEHLKG